MLTSSLSVYLCNIIYGKCRVQKKLLRIITLLIFNYLLNFLTFKGFCTIWSLPSIGCCWLNDGGHTLLEQCVAHRAVLVQYLTYLAYGDEAVAGWANGRRRRSEFGQKIN